MSRWLIILLISSKAWALDKANLTQLIDITCIAMGSVYTQESAELASHINKYNTDTLTIDLNKFKDADYFIQATWKDNGWSSMHERLTYKDKSR